MKERPILFHARSIKGILAGRKTQTRRIINPQPQANGGVGFTPIRPYRTSLGQWNWVIAETGHGCRDPFNCPYGVPGDRLWVKEAIGKSHQYPDGTVDSYYVADDAMTVGDRWPWKRPRLNGMFCPRGLSRITLEVTGVRVERVQDISNEDALAEGIDGLTLGQPPRIDFASLWNDTNGKGAWDRNDWCWVVDFKRILD